MNFTLGKKVAMTQFFDENGHAHAATVIESGSTTVTELRTKDKDGYNAVQIGYGTRKPKRVNKAQKSKWGDKTYEVVREFRTKEENSDVTVGNDTKISDILTPGDKVNITGISKGKGFQGVVKRHGFAGGRRSHGQKHSEREPGSIGSTGPQRVFKGTRMAGRMGSDRVTVKNLVVLSVDDKQNQLIIKGAVPGRRGTIVEIRKVNS